jgi:chromosome segregation ATPase
MENTQPAGAEQGGEAIAATESVANTNDAATEAQPAQSQEEKPVDPTQEELGKLRRALDRKNRDIGKKTAQQRQAERERDDYKTKYEQLSKPNGQQASGKPQLKDFADPAEWVEAVADWKTDQKLSENQKKQSEAKAASDNDEWLSTRQDNLQENEAKALKQFPDYKQVMEDNSDLLQSAPDYIKNAFWDTDEPAMALYQIIKDGELSNLLQAPNERRAAAMFAKAEIKASTPQAKQTTKAPAPLSATKGSGSSGKQLVEKSGDEILEWLKS